MNEVPRPLSPHYAIDRMAGMGSVDECDGAELVKRPDPPIINLMLVLMMVGAFVCFVTGDFPLL